MLPRRARHPVVDTAIRADTGALAFLADETVRERAERSAGLLAVFFQVRLMQQRGVSAMQTRNDDFNIEIDDTHGCHSTLTERTGKGHKPNVSRFTANARVNVPVPHGIQTQVCQRAG